MKTNQLLYLSIFFIVILMAMASCTSTEEPYFAGFNEEIYGTWINEDYYSQEGGPWHQKQVMHQWGYVECIPEAHASGPAPVSNGSLGIIDKWTDSEGNIWYKGYLRFRKGPQALHYLAKISADGTSLEQISHSDYFPRITDLNMEYPTYSIYYRN